MLRCLKPCHGYVIVESESMSAAWVRAGVMGHECVAYVCCDRLAEAGFLFPSVILLVSGHWSFGLLSATESVFLSTFRIGVCGRLMLHG
jgi:hypothetical protein